jgi:hypothetical protein
MFFTLAANSFTPAKSRPNRLIWLCRRSFISAIQGTGFSPIVKGRADLLQGFGGCISEDCGGFADPWLQAFQTAMK